MNWTERFKHHLGNQPPTQASTQLGNDCVMPLTHYRLILVAGADAQAFLQGQCTCDIQRLNQQQLVLGAHCSAKGRMNSSFYAASLDADTILLRVHSSIVAATLTGLQKYAVFSKVTLSASETYHACGIVGPQAHQHLSVQIDLPAVGKFAINDFGIFCRHDATQTEFWGTEAAIDRLLPLLPATPLHNSADRWRLATVRRGIGELESANLGAWVPQELNFQCVDGIAFDKGCYTGQEIIARLHYRGQLKKSMHRGYLHTTEAPAVGAELFASTKPQQACGRVVNVASSTDEGYELLAVCSDEAANASAIYLATHPDTPIQWRPLPYRIDYRID